MSDIEGRREEEKQERDIEKISEKKRDGDLKEMNGKKKRHNIWHCQSTCCRVFREASK